MEHLDIVDLKRLLHAKSITIEEFVKYSRVVMQRLDEAPAQDDVQMTGGVSIRRHTNLQRVGAAPPEAHRPEAEDDGENDEARRILRDKVLAAEGTAASQPVVLDDAMADADYIELSLQLQYNNRGRKAN